MSDLINREFLASAGLHDLPEDIRHGLIAALRSDLETQVGNRLSAGLPEKLMDEFGELMAGNQEVVESTLSTADPKWLEANREASPQARVERAMGAWIGAVHPNVREVVLEEAEKLRVVLQARASEILDTCGPQSDNLVDDDQQVSGRSP